MNLEQNLIDFIYEEQAKLGYSEGSVGLYYPLTTLCSLTGVDTDAEGMMKVLTEFANDVSPRLGQISFSHRGERFCINVPAEGSKYVHENIPRNAFLDEFIALIGQHGCTIDSIKELFEKYDSDYVFEEMQDEDFDYCIYFKTGENAEYRYALKDEGIHLIYHRFTVEDYQALINA